MGTWDSSLFGNDIASDIRDYYRELIESEVPDAEATRKTIDKFADLFDDPETGTAAIVGFAVTQSKIGRLDHSVRDRAIRAIDQGGDLAVWARDNPKSLRKREEVLKNARAQLTGPQPTRKRIRPRRRVLCDLVAGDVLALDLPGGPVLLRTANVQSDRYGESPSLEQLQFDGPEVPRAEIIQELTPKATTPTNPFAANSRFVAMVDVKRGGWKEAGFRKVANIPQRVGDDEFGGEGTYIFWWALAAKYRDQQIARSLEGT